MNGEPAPNRQTASGVVLPRGSTLERSEQPEGSRSSRRRGWLVRRVLLAADVGGLAAAFALTEMLYGAFSIPDPPHRLAPSAELALFVFTIPVWVLLAKLYGLYDRDEERPAHTTADDLIGVFHVMTVSVWALAVGAWLTSLATPAFGKLVVFWTVAVSAVVLGRVVARALARRSTMYLQRTVMVGADSVAQLIAEKLTRRPEYGIRLMGFVGELQQGPGAHAGHPPLLGGPSELPSIVSRLDVERVIIARFELAESERMPLVRRLRAMDVQIDVVPEPFEAMGPGRSVHLLEGIPLIGLSPIPLSRSSLLLKRAMDILLSAAGLVLLSPVLVLIALRIKLDSAGPVFYRHERVGRDGRGFDLLKFRTMHARCCRGRRYGGQVAEGEFERLMQDVSARGEFESNYKLRSDPRVTRFGAKLRRTSLDELPQLLNVLRGELSLVGPRPIVADELERYGAEAETLLSLRPGVTGYWQINGRSDNSYSERVRLDIAYASNWSLQLDLAILAHTARLLSSRPQGAY